MTDALAPAPLPPTRLLGRVIDSDLFYSFRRSKLTMVATGVTVAFFLLAIFASVLAVQRFVRCWVKTGSESDKAETTRLTQSELAALFKSGRTG